jgi:uncharacterized membrane protein
LTIRIVQQSEAQRPVEAVFAYVDDWRNVSDWLVGVETFTPVGDKEQGLGSEFDVVVHAGIKVKTRLRVTDHVEGRLIEFESVKGFKVRNRWNFEPLDEGSTLVTAETELRPPFGPAGTAMAKVLQPAVKRIMERSSTNLTARIEAH